MKYTCRETFDYYYCVFTERNWKDTDRSKLPKFTYGVNTCSMNKSLVIKQSDEIVNDIIANKIDGIGIGEGAAISLYARYLKRISAHSRNLISSIVNPFDRIGYPEKK